MENGVAGTADTANGLLLSAHSLSPGPSSNVHSCGKPSLTPRLGEELSQPPGSPALPSSRPATEGRFNDETAPVQALNWFLQGCLITTQDLGTAPNLQENFGGWGQESAFPTSSPSPEIWDLPPLDTSLPNLLPHLDPTTPPGLSQYPREPPPRNGGDDGRVEVTLLKHLWALLGAEFYVLMDQRLECRGWESKKPVDINKHWYMLGRSQCYEEKQNQVTRGQGITEAILAWVVSEGLSVDLTFEQRPEGEGEAM